MFKIQKGSDVKIFSPVPYPIMYDPAKRKLYMHEKFKALRNFALNNEPIRITYGNQKS